ncbi:hypothetical protein NDU88_006244, partial [Pleurodeles waltl]
GEYVQDGGRDGSLNPIFYPSPHLATQMPLPHERIVFKSVLLLCRRLGSLPDPMEVSGVQRRYMDPWCWGPCSVLRKVPAHSWPRTLGACTPTFSGRTPHLLQTC